MPIHFCLRCGKQLTLEQMYRKNITTSPSGFIVGHMGNSSDLPIIGAPIGGQSRLAFCCKTCGEEVNERPTEEEQKERDKKFEDDEVTAKIFLTVVWLVVGVIIFSIIKVAVESMDR